MFTGLIEDKGIFLGRSSSSAGWKMCIRTALPSAEIRYGDSIAVNGVCLTVEEIKNNEIIFHTLDETLRRTNLGDLVVGDGVNLEQALKFGKRLDGHIVSGHVDCTTLITEISNRGTDIVVKLALPKNLSGQFIEKGSICIDGISLTIAHLDDDFFTVHIIPVTWAETILSKKSVGSKVNIETDLLGKYVERQLGLYSKRDDMGGKVTMDTLFEAGFL